VGDMKMSGTTIDHLGWMKCDGRYLSVSQYYQLWLVIGYNFTISGTPATLFQLPNSGGTVPGIAGNGIDARNSTMTFVAGHQYGEYQHQLSIAEMPSHNHTITDPGHIHSQTTINDDFNGSGTSNYPSYAQPSYAGYDSGGSKTWTSTINSNVTGITLNNTGADVPHNNIQPTLVMGSMFIFTGIGRNQSNKTDAALWPYAQGTNLF